MRRTSFLYAVLFSLLIFSFFSFLEFDDENVGLPLHNKEGNWIQHGWVVAEAYNQETGQDVTALHSSEVWQFMRSNGFVLFNGQNVESNGHWEMKNGIITIKSDDTHESKTFRTEKKGKNELLLISKELKMRLLKLNAVID